MLGTLYVIGTPIGNLGDISYRAIEVLKSVDYVFCEDTRVTRRLLSEYGIDKKLISYNSFSGFSKVRKAIEFLERGSNIALVSDAGTPTISDPGVKFVRDVRENLNGARIDAVPGPSALAAALSISGAPSSSFVFLGFLPTKHGRNKIFDEIIEEKRTVVMYESPHRLMKTLTKLKEILNNDREVIVARELTKIYEEVKSGTAEEVLEYYETNKDKVKGEIVIIISSLTRV